MRRHPRLRALGAVALFFGATSAEAGNATAPREIA